MAYDVDEAVKNTKVLRVGRLRKSGGPSPLYVIRVLGTVHSNLGGPMHPSQLPAPKRKSNSCEFLPICTVNPEMDDADAKRKCL